MTPTTCDVLLFAEDPAAADCIAPIAQALVACGRRAVVLAHGLAHRRLGDRGVTVDETPTASADTVLAARAPRVLVVGTAENRDTFGLALVAAARGTRIVSVGVVDAEPNAKDRFRGRAETALAYLPDWLLVPDERTKAAFVALGAASARVVVSGHLQHDHVLAERERLDAEGRASVRARVLPSVPAGARVIVFATEGAARTKASRSSRYPVERATLAGRGAPSGRTELVLEEFLEAVRDVAPRPYLVLRLHPKDRRDDYAAYLTEFDRVDAATAPLELAHAADLVVGATSRLLVDAALLGRATVAILPRAEEGDWLPTIRAGLTVAVTTRHDLRSVLERSMSDEQVASGDASPFFRPGAVCRAVQLLDELLAGATTVAGRLGERSPV